MNAVMQIIISALLIGAAAILAAYGGRLWTEGWENQGKQVAISQLDAPSLEVIEKTKGLMFDGTGIDGATLRHLMTTGFIKIEVFPSSSISYGYYLTKEGRDYLTKNLKRIIYPEIFCDLTRIRYWEGYPSDFVKKKEEFKKKYKASWDELWTALGNLLKQDPKIQKDTIEIFNSFAASHNFETVMSQIVEPWLKKTNKGI